MRYPDEPDDVRRALIADLALTIVPTSLMGVTLVGIAAFAHASTGVAVLVAMAASGGSASVAKVGLLVMHGRRNATSVVGMDEAACWETANAALTGAIATSVAILASILFLSRQPQLHMLGAALLFGYGAGLVGPVSIRPRIANAALAISTVPPVVCLVLQGDTSHAIVAAMFAFFLLGAFESVWHVYRRAARHITTRLEMEALAHKDSLTGLLNRFGLVSAVRKLEGAAGGVAVHCIDLDGFKGVNDRFGHACGDDLLREAAARLVSLLPPCAVAARVGGDEFVVVQPGLHDDSEADLLARRMVRALCEPFPLRGEEAIIGASLGYAVRSSVDLDEMLRAADNASYRVKRAGGGGAAKSIARDAAPIRIVA